MLRLFLLGFYLVSFGQNNNYQGIVTYGHTVNEIDEYERKNKKTFYDVFDRLNKSASEIKFKLEFKGDESLFYIEKQLNSDLNPMGSKYASTIISNGTYYFNRKKDLLLRESHGYDKYTLVKSNPSKINWTLIKETKIIDTFLCYKAIRQKTIVNKGEIKEFTIVAWFCPEIPVPFGPKEFNGLPGLILEVKDVGYTFFAEKIDLSSDNIITIKPLTSKRIISEEQNIENYSKLRN